MDKENIMKNKEAIENYDAKEDNLDIFFNNFIKTGSIVKEEEVVPGFKIKLRPLSTGELLTAEAILQISSDFPVDIVAKVRGASVLSQAIIAINDMPIEDENLPPELNSRKRNALYKRLLEMPPVAIERAYKLYVRTVKEQNEKYDNIDKIFEDTENF